MDGAKLAFEGSCVRTYEVLAELGNFFQQLCSKTLKRDVLLEMKAKIPVILCKLEMIFSPRFFDINLHVAVHLVDEAILSGPIQYGWMYPVEIMLCTLKRFVRNRARPEGSIAEAYVANECLTFCSRYLNDVDTRFNQAGRNSERVDLRDGTLSVFRHGVEILGASRVTYLEHDYKIMVWYVLNNCPELEPYIQRYRTELLNKLKELLMLKKPMRRTFHHDLKTKLQNYATWREKM